MILYLRALSRVRIKWVPNFSVLCHFLCPFHKLVIYIFMHECSWACAAVLAVVRKYCIMGPLYCPVHLEKVKKRNHVEVKKNGDLVLYDVRKSWCKKMLDAIPLLEKILIILNQVRMHMQRIALEWPITLLWRRSVLQTEILVLIKYI